MHNESHMTNKQAKQRILNLTLFKRFSKLYQKRAFSPKMAERKQGKIINIASVVGIVPLRLQSPFVAAKAGVINLTRSMAIELGPYGILVNAIAPGSTLTDGTKELFYGEGGKFRDSWGFLGIFGDLSGFVRILVDFSIIV